MLALRGDQVEGLVGRQVFVLPVVDKGDVGQDASFPARTAPPSAARRASPAPSTEKSVRTTGASKVQGNWRMRGQYLQPGEPSWSEH